MAPGSRDRAILERLQHVCRYAYESAPFYRRKWDEAGFHPSQLKSLEDFEDKVPVITKADLRAAQAGRASLRRLPVHPDSDVFHVHGTSGTTGRPTAFAIGRNDWNAPSPMTHARIMWAIGVRPGDMVCIAAVFSLYMGSWGTLAGAERLGCQVPFPSAPGRPA
jgi:phenylacetate-CoA ligase